MQENLYAESPLLKYQSLSLVPSWHCDANCHHCYVPSRLRRRDQYKSSFLDRVIGGLPDGIGRICITGGEPFLHPRRLMRIIKLASKAGCSTTVVTNALWARDWKKKNIIPQARQNGLIGLSISVDEYHRPVLPGTTLVELVNYAKECGLLVDIRGAGQKAKQKMERIGRSGELLGVPSSESCFSLENVGTASSLPSDLIRKKRTQGCLALLDPVVMPDGRVTACCSARLFEFDDTPLLLGNIERETLGNILARASKSYLLAALAGLSPRRIQRIVKRSRSGKDLTRCASCVEFLKNKELVMNLQDKIATDKELRKELLGRMMMFDALYKPTLGLEDKEAGDYV